MVELPCFVRRHLDAAFVIGRLFEARWYHAGSCERNSIDSRMAARLVLYFFPVLSILIMSLLSSLERGPLSVASQVWRKGFFRARATVPGRAVAAIIKSVTTAQGGRDGEKFR